MGLNSYYNLGTKISGLRIGAVPSEWNYSDYENHADAAFASGPSVPSIVTIGRNGSDPIPTVIPYATSEDASAHYDAIVNAPGSIWFAALYDPFKQPSAPHRVDETYFGGMQVTQTKTVSNKVGIGIAAAIGILVLTATAHH